ncbi:MAG TPA: hypothetical protein VFC80_06480 [Sphaerochaeta sp.]|nr:hypothetical protein [Sphaerochaeta sp.]
MNRLQTMTLSLIQPIIYQAPSFVYQGNEDAYTTALAHLDAAEIGSEVVFALSSTARLLFVGERGAPTAEELLAIERAEEQPKTEGPYEIAAGKYEFIQLPPPETVAQIFSLSPIALDGPERIYLRLLKEAPFTTIAQLLIVR